MRDSNSFVTEESPWMTVTKVPGREVKEWGQQSRLEEVGGLSGIYIRG